MIAPLICVEWGTAQLRARLLDRSGATLGIHTEAVRLADLDRDAISERIEALSARWPEAAAPMLLSGMIGSAMGWQEVPRVQCPAAADEIAGGAVAGRIGTQDVTFLPGLICQSRFGDPDVMRGEEVVALGAMVESDGRDGVLLSVPGMHGKWLTHDSTAITQFHTSMTVELHRALANHSVLAPLMTGTPKVGAAFRGGVVQGADGGGLGRLLFAVRSRVQTGQLSAEEAPSFLFGILIGADVRENLPLAAGAQCVVAGANDVAPLFVDAIRHLGGEAMLADADRLTAAGFVRLANLL